MSYTTRRIELDGVRRQRTWPNKAARDTYVRRLEEDRALLSAGMPTRQGPVSYSELVDLFFANRPSKKSDGWLRQMLAHSLVRFGLLPVRAIRPEEVGAWIHQLHRAPKTRTHILSAFRQVLDAGIEWGYLERNPARTRAVESPGTERKRPIRPFESWDEVLAVAEAADGHKYDNGLSGPLIRFACATGVRVPSELLALTRESIVASGDFRIELHVPGTKTVNAERWIPLSAPAVRALTELPTPIDRNAPLFPIDYEQWRAEVWPDALKAACVLPRTPYEMRHTFATLALNQNVPIESLTPLMGHKNFQTTLKHYGKFTRRRLDHDIALLDALETEEEQDGQDANLGS